MGFGLRCFCTGCLAVKGRGWGSYGEGAGDMVEVFEAVGNEKERW